VNTDKRRQRKGKVHRAPYRARLEQLLREDCHTLDEMVAVIRAEFPEEDVSRSGVHRYQASMSELTHRMREIDHAANALIGEFGDSLGEKAGTLLTNAVITLVADVALKAQNQPPDVDVARKLARAAKDAIDTKRVDVNVRRVIAQEARDMLMREQAAKLDKVVKTGGLSEETAADIRKKILGIG
jgi:hypothetical protein